MLNMFLVESGCVILSSWFLILLIVINKEELLTDPKMYREPVGYCEHDSELLLGYAIIIKRQSWKFYGISRFSRTMPFVSRSRSA